MGSNIKELVNEIKKNLIIENFMGKKIAIDAFNTIYQFLAIIKGSDGKPLKNLNGKITSHLSGLLYRNLMFIEKNIKPIYCFDGIEKSKKLRWNNVKNNDYNKIRINKDIIFTSKKLLTYMGIPCVQGTAEGEAQCCLLNKTDQAFAVASQDYDCVAFGAKKMLRNFAIRAKRKKGNTYIELPIEYISTSKLFETHNITKEQLIDITILIGNDFFPGISGIGEITALKYVQNYEKIENMTSLKLKRKDGKSYERFNLFMEDVEKIRDIFINPNVNYNCEIKFRKPNYDKLKEFLVEEQNFSSSRIDNVIKRLDKVYSSKIQINLDKFW